MLEFKNSELLNTANTAFLKQDFDTMVGAVEPFFATQQEEAHCLYLMGMMYFAKQNHAIARFFGYQANNIKPNIPAILNFIGSCEMGLNNREKAAKFFLKAIEYEQKKSTPNLNEVGNYYGNLGSVYVGYNNPDKAIEYCRKALEIGITDWTVRNNLALALLEKGEYKEGWEMNQARLENKAVFPEKFYAKGSLPYWNGEENKTVVITGEQGLGDEILFASILRKAIPDMKAKGCRIIIDCQNRLVNIFRNSFPDLEIYGTKNYASYQRTWTEDVRPDCWIRIGSLCRWYANDESEFDKSPFIKIPVKSQLNPGKPRIGFSWYGGTEHTNVYHRYIPLEKWKEIFKLPYEFISLQYNEDAGTELEQFKKKHGFINIHHDKEIMADFDKTAELINGLDLVISSPQTAIHLAAAMGKETWQLTPLKAMWQMNIFDKWYEFGHVIRQSTPDIWENVMNEVKEKLQVKYANI